MSKNMFNNEDYKKYFNGEKLIGDDYKFDEILNWYEQEKNAYVNLLDKQVGKYSYQYHALNKVCAFGVLAKTSPKSLRVCAFGSAYGDELAPIRNKIKTTTLIDSAESFHTKNQLSNVYTVMANPSGKIDCDSDSFDLITCLGVLHHIPNVSFVISELYRCLNLGGILIVREPTTSMGDWRMPRVGVTKNERGIPSHIFKDMLVKVGFDIMSHRSCVYPPLAVACRKVNVNAYNSKIIVYLDLLLSKLFRWNYKYHRVKLFDKFAPASDYYVCIKK